MEQGARLKEGAWSLNLKAQEWDRAHSSDQNRDSATQLAQQQEVSDTQSQRVG